MRNIFLKRFSYSTAFFRSDSFVSSSMDFDRKGIGLKPPIMEPAILKYFVDSSFIIFRGLNPSISECMTTQSLRRERFFIKIWIQILRSALNSFFQSKSHSFSAGAEIPNCQSK